MSIGVGVRSQVSTTGMPDGQQAPAALGRMHDAGEHDAVGAAADDGVEQRVLARVGVAALPQHQLVAALGQRLGERLHRLRNTGPAIVGTTAATSRLRVEARPPASRLGT